MPKLKNPNKSQLIKMADRKFSKFWISKIGHCERCGATNVKLDLAHFKSRDYKIIRYDRKNTLVLCSWGCHKWAHSNPDLFKDFFVYLRGQQDLDYLNKKIRHLKPLGIEFYQNVISNL
jgi:hypothetical protein